MKVLYAGPASSFGNLFSMIVERCPGHEIVATPGFACDSLAGFDAAIPTMSRFDGALIETADRLQLIQQAGAGLEGVDIAAATARGIHVANVPTTASNAAGVVSEIGVYMMIGLSRDVRGMADSLAGRRLGMPLGRALFGKTVGVVGLGGIGMALIDRLRPFGMRLVGIRRTPDPAAAADLGLDWVGGPDDLPRLLAESDYVVLALPATGDSMGLMSAETFALMKPGSFLINLGRGGLVDRAALFEALRSGRLAGAGLDVFWEEPPDPDDPVFAFNVMATPHIAGATDVTTTGIADRVADNIHRLARGEAPLFLANEI